MAKADSTVAKIDARPDVPGRTTFAHNVIESIAGVAAREVAGVHKLGKGAIGDAVARVAGTAETSRGVKAEVGKTEVAIDLELVVDYGFNVHEVADKVRSLVSRRVGHMTALVVKEVNIEIVDVYYEPEQPRKRRVE